jgi:hypothetical protein
MQNIQFGVARGGCLTEPVAGHIGGYVRTSTMDRCHTK